MTGDAKQVVGILAWAQAAGLSVSEVSVGSCRVELHRVGGVREDARDADGPATESIYGRFGGPALAHVNESGIPAGELQPVVGRSR